MGPLYGTSLLLLLWLGIHLQSTGNDEERWVSVLHRSPPKTPAGVGWEDVRCVSGRRPRMIYGA